MKLYLSLFTINRIILFVKRQTDEDVLKSIVEGVPDGIDPSIIERFSTRQVWNLLSMYLGRKLTTTMVNTRLVFNPTWKATPNSRVNPPDLAMTYLHAFSRSDEDEDSEEDAPGVITKNRIMRESRDFDRKAKRSIFTSFHEELTAFLNRGDVGSGECCLPLGAFLFAKEHTFKMDDFVNINGRKSGWSFEMSDEEFAIPGRISATSAGAGKLRLFAIGNYVAQSLPYHE